MVAMLVTGMVYVSCHLSIFSWPGRMAGRENAARRPGVRAAVSGRGHVRDAFGKADRCDKAQDRVDHDFCNHCFYFYDDRSIF
ncbi:hypothetical protein H845_1224 [Komagataeibacter xylinus E25]|nr:hypothetical protein H845_1224 [Komagataeibacter xylinus E25]